MKTKRKIFLAFVLNLFFSIFELVGGIFTGSIAITSDAIHDFGDATSIGISYFLEKLSDKKPNQKYTFGYARFSVLGGFLTTIILLLSSIIVIYNAISRIITPIKVNYSGMLIFAIIGFIVNLTATIFTHGGKSINQKAVNLHMLEDVFGWLIVLVGSIIMHFTNFYLIDPILSLFLALFIIINCVKNLIEILNIFTLKCPNNFNLNEIIEHIEKIDGVIEVHHLHVWTIDGQTNFATLHTVVNEFTPAIKSKIKKELLEHEISHVTIEMETILEKCNDKICVIKKIEHCHHHH